MPPPSSSAAKSVADGRAGGIVPSRRPLRPGAGHLEVRGLSVDGGDPVHLLAGPAAPARVRGDAHRLQALLAGCAPVGTALLDGQDLALVAPDGVWRIGAVLPAPEPAPGSTVEAALTAAWPNAGPEDRALAWRRAGLAGALPLSAALHRRVGSLGQQERARLRVALGLLGQPVVLVVDRAADLLDAEVRDELDMLLSKHSGAVIEATPADAWSVREQRSTQSRSDVVVATQVANADVPRGLEQ